MEGKITNNEDLNDAFMNFGVISVEFFRFPNPLIKDRWNKNILFFFCHHNLSKMYILSSKSLMFNCKVTFTLNIFSQDYNFWNAFCENGTIFPHLDESYFSINHPLSSVGREQDAHHLCFQGKELLWYTYQGWGFCTQPAARFPHLG